ncbi:hypothetical protein HMPREF3156_00346 [Neisseria sp. HMSC06F02]|nr:hypothetical protein HMPREF3156_00346 [Neisseria sp. HMSC06F02]
MTAQCTVFVKRSSENGYSKFPQTYIPTFQVTFFNSVLCCCG